MNRESRDLLEIASVTTLTILVLCGVWLLLILLLPQIAKAAESPYPGFKITWDAPTQREGGGLLLNEEILQYNVFATNPNGKRTRFADVLASTQTNYTVSYSPKNLILGEWCFTIRAKDNQGRISEFSEDVCVDVGESTNQPIINAPENVSVVNESSGEVIGINFLIGWTTPDPVYTEPHDGDADIRGYNISYTINGGDKQYIGFSVHNPDSEIQSYVFNAVEPGLYCFTLNMRVSESTISDKTDPVCSMLTITSPLAPDTISVEFLRPSQEAQSDASAN